jgi:hypothetical protein
VHAPRALPEKWDLLVLKKAALRPIAGTVMQGNFKMRPVRRLALRVKQADSSPAMTPHAASAPGYAQQGSGARQGVEAARCAPLASTNKPKAPCRVHHVLLETTVPTARLCVKLAQAENSRSTCRRLSVKLAEQEDTAMQHQYPAWSVQAASLPRQAQRLALHALLGGSAAQQLLKPAIHTALRVSAASSRMPAHKRHAMTASLAALV